MYMYIHIYIHIICIHTYIYLVHLKHGRGYRIRLMPGHAWGHKGEAESELIIVNQMNTYIQMYMYMYIYICIYVYINKSG